MLPMIALRRSPGPIDRHTPGRHHRFQAAFCAEPVQLVCVRPALPLEQQFCIVPVATMGVGEIRRMRHRRTGAAPRRGRSEECRACGWSSSSFLSSELTQRPIITQPRRRRHPDTASPCCAGRPCTPAGPPPPPLRVPMDRLAAGRRSSLRAWAAERTNHPREVIKAALVHVLANRTQAYARSDMLAPPNNAMSAPRAPIMAGADRCRMRRASP